MLIFLAFLCTGLATGILGALLGLGGGIFLVPALTLIFHLPIRISVGTSLVGVIATSAGVASIAPRGRGADVALALRLEVFTAAGAIAGGIIAGSVSPDTLHVLFAMIVFLTAAYILYKALHPGGMLPERLFRKGYQVHHWPAGVTVSTFAGMTSGLMGVGGGFIKVPVMHTIMGVPLGTATATSNFMVGITASASIFVYYGRGDIYPLIAVPTAIGVFAGAMVGVYILPRIRVAWLRFALIGLLILIGVRMLWQGLF